MAPIEKKYQCAGLNHCSIAWVAVLVFFVAAVFSQEISDDGAASAEITQINSPPTPLMRNDSLLYTMDMMFKHLKSKFWSYPDNSNRAVLIELYGLDVSVPPMQFPRSSPVRKVSVKNQKTKMALSGRLSTICIAVDKGWNFEVSQPDSNSLRVLLSKKLDLKEIKEAQSEKKSKPFLSYIGAVFGAAVAVSVAVVAVINK